MCWGSCDWGLLVKWYEGWGVFDCGWMCDVVGMIWWCFWLLWEYLIRWRWGLCFGFVGDWWNFLFDV